MKGPKDKKSVGARAGHRLVWTFDQLEKLLDFMAAHGLEEFEYEHGGLHIRLRKAGASKAAPSHVAQKPLASPARRAGAAPAASEAHPVAVPPPAAAPAEELHVIKSPIVGTFYSAPSPDAPPFVNVGDTVRGGASGLHRRSHEIDE